MQIIYFILIISLGIIFGIITGLLPGIHINMISNFILINIGFLIGYFDINLLIIFILTMGVTHSFVDFIPSVLFGVSNPDTSISILPAHKMVIEGEAYKAIFLSSIGSLFGMFFSFIFAFLFYFFLNIFYNSIKNYIVYLLIIVLLILIYFEEGHNKKFYAILIILFAGGLGILTLNSLLLTSPLLVLFSGIFGIASLLNSLLDEFINIEKQNLNINFKINLEFLKAVLVGGISASLACISPGLGNSQAASISSIFFKNLNSELFIVTTSAINTTNFILSFITFYLIDKTRNGSVFVISQIIEKISLDNLFLYFTIIFFISIISFYITLYLGKIIIKYIFKLNIKLLNLLILTLITILVFTITGYYGILVLICSSFLGIFTILIGVRRVHLLAILLVPVIINMI